MGNVSSDLTDEVRHTTQKAVLRVTDDKYFAYDDNRFDNSYRTLDLYYTGEEIAALYVLARPVSSMFGECEHWTIKFITTKYYIEIDFHTSSDELAVLGLWVKERSCEESKKFFNYYKKVNEKKLQKSYKIIASITPTLTTKGIHALKDQARKYCNQVTFPYMFESVELEEDVHYNPIHFNKDISDLIPMIKKFKSKDSNGYHFLTNNCQTFVVFLVQQLCFKNENKNQKYFYYEETIQKLKKAEESRISSRRKVTTIGSDFDNIENISLDECDNTNEKHSDKKIEN